MATTVKTSEATQDNIKKLMQKENCQEFRIIHSDEFYTTDYIDNRLNVEVDKNNKISRVWVG